jgi:hypothetical protein
MHAKNESYYKGNLKERGRVNKVIGDNVYLVTDNNILQQGQKLNSYHLK